MREEEPHRERESRSEREREGKRAGGLLVPLVHILPLIPALLYPLHLKQRCLLLTAVASSCGQNS